MNLTKLFSQRSFPPQLGSLFFALGRLLGIALALAGSQPLAAAPRGSETALDRYVAAPDSSFEFHVAKTLPPGKGYKAWTLDMTSQTWLTPAEVNRPVWKHWVNVIAPDEVSTSTALLFITGGDNASQPRDPDGMLIKIALATKSVVAELRMVPNQTLIFENDGKPRKEDDLIAYTWVKYLKTGDERWPARLPMTKSAVRAMDAVTAFCASAEAGSRKVDSFVVSGGSKRGWTTWTTAAVDTRVVAIAPLVIDMLNVVPSFEHHYGAYGFWAPAVGDYSAAGIMNWMHTKEYRNLMKIEEPFEYRERLTMPKLIVNATGDQFFLPDSSKFYFNELKGVKYLRYVPNADHSMKDTDVPETLAAWHHAIVNKSKLPRFSWNSRKDLSLEIKPEDQPSAVKLWKASNPKARDFRVDTIGKTWTSADLAPDSAGAYVGRVEKPAEGYTAFLVELTYQLPGSPAPLKLTTQVNVLPDVEPFKWEHPKNPN